MAHDPRTHSDFPHGHDDSKRHGHGEPFTVEEWRHFQSEDKHAGRAIVGLMTAVFALGFCGALAIAIITAS